MGLEFARGGVTETGLVPGKDEVGQGRPEKACSKEERVAGARSAPGGAEASQSPPLPGPWVQSDPAARRAPRASEEQLRVPGVLPPPLLALPASPLGQHLLEPLALGGAGDVGALATEQFLVAGAIGADEGTWGHLRAWAEEGSHWGVASAKDR